MKIVTQCALTGAFFGLALACANPVQVTGCSQNQATSNCDVILAAPSDFGADAGTSTGSDASVSDGLMGSINGSSSGGSSSAELGSGSRPPLQQTGGAGGNTGMTSGTAAGNAGSTGGGAAGASAAGAGGGANGGAGGASGSAGAASGGAAGTGAGTAGTPGTAGSTGTAGTGAVSNANFDVANCDFTNTTGCENLDCAVACPANKGSYCPTNCPIIVTCVSQNTATANCITADDPLCGQRNGATTKACTTPFEQGGGNQLSDPTQPASVALAYVECICSKPRPAP